MVFEKFKQQRESGFKGIDLVPEAPSPELQEKKAAEAASRYSAAEYKAMRKNGFSAKSMLQRCEALDKHAGGTGFAETYHIVYRNFSRNVHSTDITESLLHVDPTTVSPLTRGLVESRDAVACNVVAMSALGMVGFVNNLFKLGFGERIKELNYRRTLRELRGLKRRP